jgi:hypothetical protein
LAESSRPAFSRRLGYDVGRNQNRPTETVYPSGTCLMAVKPAWIHDVLVFATD